MDASTTAAPGMQLSLVERRHCTWARGTAKTVAERAHEQKYEVIGVPGRTKFLLTTRALIINGHRCALARVRKVCLRDLADPSRGWRCVVGISQLTLTSDFLILAYRVPEFPSAEFIFPIADLRKAYFESQPERKKAILSFRVTKDLRPTSTPYGTFPVWNYKNRWDLLRERPPQ